MPRLTQWVGSGKCAILRFSTFTDKLVTRLVQLGRDAVDVSTTCSV